MCRTCPFTAQTLSFLSRAFGWPRDRLYCCTLQMRSMRCNCRPLKQGTPESIQGKLDQPVGAGGRDLRVPWGLAVYCWLLVLCKYMRLSRDNSRCDGRGRQGSQVGFSPRGQPNDAGSSILADCAVPRHWIRHFRRCSAPKGRM